MEDVLLMRDTKIAAVLMTKGAEFGGVKASEQDEVYFHIVLRANGNGHELRAVRDACIRDESPPEGPLLVDWHKFRQAHGVITRALNNAKRFAVLR